MPVFHFTLHAYRSWPADHPDGYCRRGIKGVLPADPVVARQWDRHARALPVAFDRLCALRIIEVARKLALERQWRLHGIAVTAQHIHAVLSWRGREPPETVKQYLKGRTSRELSAAGLHHPGKKFSRGALAVQVRDQAHLRRLLEEYLPGHCGEFWREGMAESVTITKSTPCRGSSQRQHRALAR